MLTIRSEQMAALGRAKEEAFLLRTEAQLQAVLPESCAAIGPDEVRRLVRRAYKRAEGYGLTRDYDILRFINLTFALGPGFDTELPWAAELFAHPDLEPTTRIDLVDQLATLEIARTSEAKP